MPLFPASAIFPRRTLHGPGRAADLLPACAGFGMRGILVHGRSLAAAGVIRAVLDRAPPGLAASAWQHAGGEPTLDDLNALLETARAHRAEWIAGVGGGSVLDLAKACAGLFRAGRPPADYHRGTPVEAPALPFAAVPATAGTGAEATPNAVLIDRAARRKASLRADDWIARLVILDPRLPALCPRPVIAFAGLDALTQALEAYISRQATAASDALALEALRLIGANLEPLYRGPGEEAADGLLVGSYLAGLAFAMARLGVVHGLAHPLGVRFGLPHGHLCGACLPHAVALNRKAMGAKYAAAGTALGGDLLEKLRGLLGRLDVAPPLRGIPIEDREAIAAETLAAPSTRTNPKPVTAADVGWLLDRLAGL